ncbi:MAG: hypothetical protein M0P31_12100 [Solirubrobacteraceae bacterium]|nr:hypothetical protein [Solirubrobacteraceae bacterium]
MAPSDPAPVTYDDAPEVLDAQIVAVDATEDRTEDLQPTRRNGVVVAKQAAAVVTTGFVAGALATAVVSRRVGRARARRSPSLRGLEATDGQRFLVEIHRLRPR